MNMVPLMQAFIWTSKIAGNNTQLHHVAMCCFEVTVASLWWTVLIKMAWFSSTLQFVYVGLVLSLLICPVDPYWQPLISSSQEFSAWMYVKRASPPGAETAVSGCGISTSNQLPSLISGKPTRDIKVMSNCLPLFHLVRAQKGRRLSRDLLRHQGKQRAALKPFLLSH